MRTIAIVNQKGGCGKTTTSINLSAFLALQQKRVLLVDMDPQGHATLGASPEAVEPSRTMSDLFLQREDGQAIGLRDISRTIRQNFDLAPGDIFLSAVPEKLRGVNGREDILGRAFDEVRDQYDYIVVDCPPNIGLLTFNAVKACSEAIVPMDPSFFSLHGIAKTLETFDVLGKETGHQVTPRVLITLYYGRTPFVKAVLEDIRKHLEGLYFQTVIRYSVKLAEAASHGLPIAHYCRQCAGFEDYRAFATEVLQAEAAVAVGEEAALEAGFVATAEPAMPAETTEPEFVPSEVIWN
jgi:chromosome partitioning protein